MPGTMPAVAVKPAVAEPAGTVIAIAGTGSSALLLERETDVPPAGAAWLRFTVQDVLIPLVKLAGAHVSEEMVIAATKLIVDVCELPLSVATRVAL